MDAASAAYIFSVGIIIFLIYVLSLWQVFYKAGYEGWKCLIPIYNWYILTKIGRQPIWVFVFLLIPLLNIIGHIFLAFGVAKAFGKGSGIGILLFLFQFFTYMYLGWGDSEYQKVEAGSTS